MENLTRESRPKVTVTLVLQMFANNKLADVEFTVVGWVE
jgi:hypothetical protein